MDTEVPLFYEFDEFRIDVERRLLLRKGELAALTPKVFDLLLVFIEHRGEILEKDLLMELLWSNSFVEESNLVQNVAVLRRALGEKSKENKFIVTIPGRGYRFIGDVTSTNGKSGRTAESFNRTLEPVMRSAGSNVLPIRRSNFGSIGVAQDKLELAEPVVSHPIHARSEATVVGSRPRPVRRSLFYVAGGSFIVLALVAIGSYSFRSSPSPPTVAAGSTLAVLPLKPVASESRDPIIEFAIAESLILKISTAPNLIVRPLGTVRKYVELDKDPINAGKELNADYVLSSNYQLVDGKIRVTSQLFNIQTGKVEATFKAESDTQEKFAMQDAVANEIGNAMFRQFGQPGTTFAASRGTNNEEAYRLYLQGHYLVEKKTIPDAARAIELFDSAISLDQNFAQAWAGKANAHCTFAHIGGIQPKVAFESARPALKKAFELDPNLAETLAVAGFITYDYDWDFEKGLQYLRKAIELNPKYEASARAYASRLASNGQYDEAIRQIKASIDMFPNSIFHQADYAHILYRSRRYDEAIAQIHRVLEMDPNMSWVRRLAWVSYHLKGDHNKAYEWFIKVQESNNVDPAIIQGYRELFTSDGWGGVLKRYSEVVRARSKPADYDPNAGNVVFASSLVGDKDTAFRFLETSLRQRDLWIPLLLRDPVYDNLRDDPRYAKLLRSAGLPV
ncbi:MAG: winged helix-turn-helix domain-containing tetratricopeptide repeat protein [Pyrinomonadaceae bacterium]